MQKVHQKCRNDRAIALIAENVTKSLDQVKAIARQSEVQRLACLAQIEMIKQNANEMQKILDDAIRRRDAGEDLDASDIATPLPVQASHTYSIVPHRPDDSLRRPTRPGMA